MLNISNKLCKLPSVFSLMLILLWSHSSLAQLRPFQAIYTSQWDLGISLSGQAERSLIKNDDGSYRLTTAASAMVASLTESLSLIHISEPTRPY